MTDLLRRTLTPAALTWAAGVRLHRALWRGRQYRAPCPVVSVGALAMGGSGKTPMAWWIARELVALGAGHVLLVVRGHGRREARSAAPRLLDHTLTGAAALRTADVGDEAAMLATLRSVAGLDAAITIGVGRRRDLVVRHMLDARRPIDAVVLDDGLQHHRIARDLDLVLVAPDVRAARVFPAGRLREPLSQLPPDALVQVHAGDGAAPRDTLGAAIVSHHRLRGLRCVHHRDEPTPLDDAVVLVSAVGRNDNVRRLVERAGHDIAEHLALRDHARFSRAALRALHRRTPHARAWLTTAKDWPRLREALPDDAPAVFVLELEIAFTRGRDVLRDRLAALLAAR